MPLRQPLELTLRARSPPVTTIHWRQRELLRELRGALEVLAVLQEERGERRVARRRQRPELSVEGEVAGRDPRVPFRGLGGGARLRLDVVERWVDDRHHPAAVGDALGRSAAGERQGHREREPARTAPSIPVADGRTGRPRGAAHGGGR